MLGSGQDTGQVRLGQVRSGQVRNSIRHRYLTLTPNPTLTAMPIPTEEQPNPEELPCPLPPGERGVSVAFLVAFGGEAITPRDSGLDVIELIENTTRPHACPGVSQRTL